ncbi:MAG TPA: FAD-binding and (Fe-S)-binding domain-containing protein, partial [Terracidiphilus sp.]|nr:FAD-binding and (Fe-S)-binding domain-containing protein [Terracidiphilus sp.]
STLPILGQFPPLAHERFAAHRELEALLKARLRGDVLFDMGSRALFAADASNYRQLPIGVVYPRDEADVEAALEACRATGAAVLSRGAGTSLAGQAANAALILDFSRYMNALTSIDPVARLATVQPGIVLDRLRDAAEQHHLTYAPDPATHSRCTLGGMIGNNSCGTHGLLGGKVVDNVHSLDLLLYDGTRLTVGPTPPEELARRIAQGGRVGEIYSGLARIRDQYAGLIRQRFPRIPRRVSGYNLDELLPETDFNVARALVGTEGTCATILSATLNLTASPPHRILTVLGFEDGFLAADAVPRVLEHKPIGLEGFDGLLLDFMRRKGLAMADVALLPPGRGFLLVEIGAWSAEDAQQKTEALIRDVQTWPHAPAIRTYSAEDAAHIWHVRESALGATVFVPGEPEGWEGWDDSAVPPEHLGAYLRQLAALMAEYGYRSPLYGHYGQGCVHLRINFDFRSVEGLRKFREFIDRAADLVLSFGGSLSGEHGEGQARAALLPKMFGPELMQAFREFKALWDPGNHMNPGKLVSPERVYDPVENLRHGPRTTPDRNADSAPSIASAASGGRDGWENRPLETHFAFTHDRGSLEYATERCVGVGACRNTTGGVMCPSYRATGQEQHSTRGRARLLWEMLAGALRDEGFQSESVHEALDLCLSCKACKSECPVQVDMAAYKSEYLAQRYKSRLHPLPHYVFGFADKLARLGALTPALTNRVLTGPITSPLIKHILRVAQPRQLPALAPKTYLKSRKSAASKSTNVGAPGLDFQARERNEASAREAQSAAPQVLLWPDTWNNYYHPQSLHAAESLLVEAGFQVRTPQGHLCCGRALYDFGHLGAARRYLANVLETLSAEIDACLPVIFLEPSCASVFKDELPELFPNNPRAQRLREQVWLLADWLAAKAPHVAAGRLQGKNVLVHGHCHHKSVFGGPASEVALLRAAGASVTPIQSTCCGMAGPFGFEADKFEVSKAVANLDLLPAVNAAVPGTLIVADGFSCREQIHQLSNRQAVHFAEVLAHSKQHG